jgi:uncharacterized OB-fold protein
MSGETPLRVPGSMPISHRYTAGIAGERFFRALAERGVFLATPCTACRVTYCPARSFCERCFAELDLDAAIEVGPAGTLVGITTVRIGFDGAPLAVPVPIGLIRPDGATTVVAHRVTPEAAARGAGAAVVAILRPRGERQGALNDVLAFALAVPEGAAPRPPA